MAELSTKRRNKLPASTFGDPKDRAYPMPDAEHAANAKARATQEEEAGRLSPSMEAKIDAKANRILHKGAAKDAMAHTAKHHADKGA